MENQYWRNIHVLQEQTQLSETDDRMRGFLSGLHIKSPEAFLEDAGNWYSGLSGIRSLMFANIGYVGKYTTNVSQKEDFHVSVYGVKGIPKVARETKYVNYYISEEHVLMGADFFDYVFGSYYLSEEEARTTPENITALLDEKTGIQRKKGKYTSLEIQEQDRELVCRIVERLWFSQLEDVGTRFVLCLPDNEIQSRSLEILKQVYLLLPQRLRLNMGFCTNSNLDDIKHLTENYSLPVHVFTMAVNNIEEIKEKARKMDFKYPVVFFDAENPESEICSEKRLALIRDLSQKISPSSDAKIAYAEKMVLKEQRGAKVSFTNLQKIFEKINSENFCWWEQSGLNSIGELFRLYREQDEMMKVDILYEEALNAFYRNLLPRKDYANQIAALVMDENAVNREELLKFFADELRYAGILDSLYYVKQTTEAKDTEHEKQMLAAEEARREEEHTLHMQEINRLEEQYMMTLQQKEGDIQNLKEEYRKREQELREEQKQQKDSFIKHLKTAKATHEKELKEKEADCDERIAAARTEKDREIKDLKRALDGLRNTDTNQELERLKKEREEAEKNIISLKENVSSHEKKQKRFLGLVIGAGILTVLCLAAVVLFGIKAKNIGVMESERVVLESERDILESEKTRILEEKNAKESEWKKYLNKKESEIRAGKTRESELESEVERLKAAGTESEMESETEAIQQSGENAEESENAGELHDETDK